MERLIKHVVTTTVLVCVCTLVLGCSGIGYLAGSSIDGDGDRVDSVGVVREKNSTEVQSPSRPQFDTPPLTSLLNRVASKDDNVVVHAIPAPGLGSADFIEHVQVEVITRYSRGSYVGKKLSLDSVMVLKTPSEGNGRYRLFPDQQVRLKLKDGGLTSVTGTVSRLSEKSIALRMGEGYRGFPLGTVDSLFMSDGITLAGQELASISGRLVTVQCIQLNSSPRLFIPLEEVEQVRVKGLSHWGTWKIALTTTGAIIDVGAILFVTSLPSYGGPLLK